eukprot:14027025-Alexandrium_andersonii.AAC.1
MCAITPRGNATHGHTTAQTHSDALTRGAPSRSTEQWRTNAKDSHARACKCPTTSEQWNTHAGSTETC